MVFIIAIIFILQIFILGIIVSTLLSLNINILILNDSVDSMNLWIEKQIPKITSIIEDLKCLTQKNKERLKKKSKIIIFKQAINLLEWGLLLLLKPRAKVFIFIYKLSKFICKKLLLIKNMI